MKQSCKNFIIILITHLGLMLFFVINSSFADENIFSKKILPIKKNASIIEVPDVKEKIPKKIKKSITDPANRQLKNFIFSDKTSLISRVILPPDFVLKYLREFDSRPDYTPYLPDKNEFKMIEEYLKLLPALNIKIMKKRLIGIYFVNNFLGSGFADWVVDKDNKIYVFLVFNTSVLKKNISELITFKEKTNFIMDDKSFDIFLDAGNKYNGFLYILIHESSHVVDYVKRLTPFVEPDMLKIWKKYVGRTVFTEGIWSGHKKTINHYPFRKDVTFYGFRKGPKIKISNAVNIYKELYESPFCTLYGSLNWAEDVVEMLTFYHLTSKLQQKFVINVLKNGKVIYSIEPMKIPKVKKRLHIKTSLGPYLQVRRLALKKYFPVFHRRVFYASLVFPKFPTMKIVFWITPYCNALINASY